MNLNKLLDEIKRLKEKKLEAQSSYFSPAAIIAKLQGITETVKAVDDLIINGYSFINTLSNEDGKVWKQIKEELGV